MTDTPLAADASLLQLAEHAFDPDRPERVAVSVSGGSDSMAALHLLARAGHSLQAVTVDHGLRDGSLEEARFVAGVCGDLGVKHTTLRWEHGEVEGNLQDAARTARYGLIADWASGQGISHVALGHTGDDQAETFLMRLARGAGVDGLSGMRDRWTQGGVTFVRPFLARSRADLRAFLKRHRHAWVEDPSNEDLRFERVKARAVLAELAPLGITADVLGGVARNLSEVREALELHCAEVARSISRTETGDVVFDRQGLMAAAPEVRRRLLVGALRWVASAPYPPRAEKVAALEHAIVTAADKTLAGCLITVSDAQVRVFREAEAVRGTVCGTKEVWDRRWRLDGPHAPDLRIRALGEEGLRACPDWRETGMPRVSLLASPSIWRGGVLISAPIAGFVNGWRAKLAKGRDDFPSSLISR